MDEFKRYVAKQNSFYYNIFMVNLPYHSKEASILLLKLL